MHLRPAFFAVAMAVFLACWFAVPAQQQTAGAPNPVAMAPDPAEIPAMAGEISQRSEHLKPMLEQVHTADWIAKGAPEAYVSEWSSLIEQNQAIGADMATIVQNPEATEYLLKAIFRVHRFDGDLGALLNAVRRYQNPALADLIESVAAGDQRPAEKLQQYVLDLVADKERQLDVENEEAQRCRSTLANQPVRPAAPRKTNGTSIK